MPKAPNAHPGVVLAWTLDRASAEFEADFTALKRTLADLQAEQGFNCFIPLTRRDGTSLTISIIPAVSEEMPRQAPFATELDALVDRQLTDVSGLLDQAVAAPLDMDSIEIP